MGNQATNLHLEITDSKLQVEKTGDGNSTRYDIKIENNGQYDFTELKKTVEGITLRLYGEWEFDELIDGLIEVRNRFNNDKN
jgi:hypothetical protein